MPFVCRPLFLYVFHPAQRVAAWHWVAAWGLGAAALSTSVHGAEAALAGATPAACAAGWDQLLTPAQREEQSRLRRCSAAVGKPSRPVLAAQLGVYKYSSSRLLDVRAVGTQRTGMGIAPRPSVPASRPLPRAGDPPKVRANGPASLAPLVDHAAREHDIDPLLLHSIARVESRHRPDAVSHAGARGLMQVILPTARRFGVEGADQLHDPQTNLQVSARYLKTLQQRFGNDLELVLAAYNAGEGAVEKHGRRIPPYRETQEYVRKVLSEYALLRNVSRGQVGLAAVSSEKGSL